MRAMKIMLAFSFAAGLLPTALRQDAFGAKISNSLYTDADPFATFGAGSVQSSNYLNSSSAESIVMTSSPVSGYLFRAGSLSSYPKPSPVSDLEAITVSSSGIKLTWSVPYGDSFSEGGKIGKYMIRYSTVSPINDDGQFAAALEYSQDWTPLEIGENEERTVEGFSPATTYYFVIKAVNDDMVPGEISNTGYAFALVPLPPLNLKISASANTVTLTWTNPPGYKGAIPFSDEQNPAYPYELMGYRIYRATCPTVSDWSYVGETSSDTLTWQDILVSNNEFFYYVAAYNKAGVSDPSYIRGHSGKGLYFVEGEDYLLIPEKAADAFLGDSTDPLSYYTIKVSSVPSEVRGKILKSVNFAVYRGGITPVSSFSLPDYAEIKLKYRKSGDEFVPSAGSDGKRIGIYYYNGDRWLNLYGNVDESACEISVRTKRLGKFQIREVTRQGAFSADASGLMNRMITPNGDGKNDKTVFIFDNPRGSEVKGKIFDLKGAFVAKMAQSELENSLEWDGRSNGRPVPGGIYIYQIEAEGEIYNGTVVVIK